MTEALTKAKNALLPILTLMQDNREMFKRYRRHQLPEGSFYLDGWIKNAKEALREIEKELSQ